MADALSLGLKLLPHDATCVAREYFNDVNLEKMGFKWMGAVHEPIRPAGPDDSPWLLSASGYFNDDMRFTSCINAGAAGEHCRWPANGAFLFGAPDPVALIPG